MIIFQPVYKSLVFLAQGPVSVHLVDCLLCQFRNRFNLCLRGGYFVRGGDIRHLPAIHLAFVSYLPDVRRRRHCRLLLKPNPESIVHVVHFNAFKGRIKTHEDVPQGLGLLPVDIKNVEALLDQGPELGWPV